MVLDEPSSLKTTASLFISQMKRHARRLMAPA